MNAPAPPTEYRLVKVVVTREYTVRTTHTRSVLVAAGIDEATAHRRVATSLVVNEEDDDFAEGDIVEVSPQRFALSAPAPGQRHQPDLVVEGDGTRPFTPSGNRFDSASKNWRELEGRRWLVDGSGAAVFREDCPLPSHGGASWPPTLPIEGLPDHRVSEGLHSFTSSATQPGHPGTFDARFAPVLQAGAVWSDGTRLSPAVVKRDDQVIACVMPLDVLGRGSKVPTVDSRGRGLGGGLPDTIDLSAVAKP